MKYGPFLVLVLMVCSCHKSIDTLPPSALQSINGRDEIIAYNQSVRRPLYQAKVPLTWKRIDPAESESLLDTKKPLVTFIIGETLHLVVHNFPSKSLEERIDCAAQVERWGAQLTGGMWHTKRVCHDGFAGLSFIGSLDARKVYAWSMQLDAEHYQTLHFLSATVEEEEHYNQMAADYTIKVSGPADLLEKHEEEIALFVNSFQLIQEIPSRL